MTFPVKAATVFSQIPGDGWLDKKAVLWAVGILALSGEAFVLPLSSWPVAMGATVVATIGFRTLLVRPEERLEEVKKDLVERCKDYCPTKTEVAAYQKSEADLAQLEKKYFPDGVDPDESYNPKHIEQVIHSEPFKKALNSLRSKTG